jgi:hypothetical protein
MPASRKTSQRQDRSTRLRAALRENLKRRKAQARARSTAQLSAGDERAQDSAAVGPDKAKD